MVIEVVQHTLTNEIITSNKFVEQKNMQNNIYSQDASTHSRAFYELQAHSTYSLDVPCKLSVHLALNLSFLLGFEA